MNAIDALMSRVSAPAAALTDPAPEGQDLETILQAAMSAPDHRNLKPWRFVIIRGENRARLGDVFADALRQRKPEATEAELDKARQKPLKAPLTIAVIARIQDDPKVPEIEQILAAGAATENLLLAAHALGFGAMWVTGDNAYDWNVTQALGLGMDERLAGFVRLGSLATDIPAKTREDHRSVTEEWTGPADSEEPAI